MSLRRGGRDSTVARACRATGETVFVPPRNWWSKVGRITGATGKAIEDETVAARLVVAERRGNARGALVNAQLGYSRFKHAEASNVSCAHRRADFRRVCGCCPLRSPLRHTRVQAGGVVDSVIALGARLPQRLVEKEDGLARRFGQVAGRPAHLPRHLQVVPPNAATRYTGRAALLSYKPPRVITTHFVLAKRIDPFHHSDCRHKHVLS